VTTPEPRPANPPGTDPTLAAPGAGPAAPTAGSVTGPAAPSTVAGRDTGPPSGQAARPRHTGRTIGRTIALALLVFVTVLLVLFVMFNTQTVDISLVFSDVRAPLVLALLIAAGLGALLVALAGAVMSARRKNR
jgi:uncharacterized integral membrane protein